MKGEAPNSHGKMLTIYIQDLLAGLKLTLRDIAAVACSIGPGSYTGLRIGLSVAKGICYGTNVPLLALSTLRHMASAFPGDYVFPMIDARRMEVYGALYGPKNNELIAPFPCIVTSYDWSSILQDRKVIFTGDGVSKSAPVLKEFPDAVLNTEEISARSMCGLAYEMYTAEQFADLAYEVPFYLKDANVTEPKKKPL